MTGPLSARIQVLPIPADRPSRCDHAPFISNGVIYDGHTTMDTGAMRDSVLRALIDVEPCPIERQILSTMLLARAYRIGSAS